jgi:hypothetical protein
MKENLQKLLSEANLSPELVAGVTDMVTEAIDVAANSKAEQIAAASIEESNKALEEMKAELDAKAEAIVLKEAELEEKWKQSEISAVNLTEEIEKVKGEYDTQLSEQAQAMAEEIETSVSEIREEMGVEVAQIAEEISQVTTAIIEGLSTKIDMMADKWLEDNEVALVSESVVHAAKKFLTSINQSSADLSIELNESSRNIREEYEEQVLSLVNERNELKSIVEEAKMEKLAEEKSAIITSVVESLTLSEEQATQLTKQALKYGVENIDQIMVTGIAKALFAESAPVKIEESVIEVSKEVSDGAAESLEDDISPAARAAAAKAQIKESRAFIAPSVNKDATSLNAEIAAIMTRGN